MVGYFTYLYNKVLCLNLQNEHFKSMNCPEIQGYFYVS